MKSDEVFLGPFVSLVLLLASGYGLCRLVFYSNIGTVGFLCAILCAYGIFVSLAHILYYGDRVLDKINWSEQTQLRGTILVIFLFGSILFTATGVAGLYNSIIALFMLIGGMAFWLSYLDRSGLGARMNCRIGAVEVAKLQSVPFWIVALVVTFLFVLLGVYWR